MVTRATAAAPPADGDQQMPRLPAVNLPSIHDLNLGSNMARDSLPHPPFAARATSAYAAHLPLRPSLPHLPHSQTFGMSSRLPSDSFEHKGKVESAAPSPTQAVLHTPATPSFSSTQIKDECARCGAPLSSAQAECSCGHFRFIHPFQPHSRHLAAGFDDSFPMASVSRRGSGARSSFDSLSCGSNPPSRRGSCVTYPGISKQTPRRRSTVVSKKASVQQELKKLNKADREKSSRRSLRHEHKKMEIRQHARGWIADVTLNSNNQKNSGLDGKKLEILKQTNNEARNNDLLLLDQYNNQQRMLAILLQGKLTPDDAAWIADLEREIEAGARKLVKALEDEDRDIMDYFEKEDKKEAEALAKERKGDRYPTPMSSSTSPSPTPTYPHYSI